MDEPIRQNEPQIYNYAGVMADLAFHIEQEVLTNVDKHVAFRGTVEKQQQDDQTTYVFSNIEMPDVNKQDQRFEIGHQVTFAKFKQDDDYGYVENITLLIDGNVMANFTHVSSPEVFAAVEKHYQLYETIQKQVAQPALASAFD